MIRATADAAASASTGARHDNDVRRIRKSPTECAISPLTALTTSAPIAGQFRDSGSASSGRRDAIRATIGARVP